MEIFIEVLKSVIYGIIEGLTEWLPVSSTGHLILFEELFWKSNSESFKLFIEMFRVVIQLGAILAIVASYFRKLNPFSPKKDRPAKKATWELWFKIVIACVPAAIVGLPFNDEIDAVFYNFPTVAVTLIVYGIIFIAIESVKRKEPTVNSNSELSYKAALIIGVAQLLALIPGTSRSGVTIITAMLLGCSRTVSAEFSFFLAIPIMAGASLVKCGSFARDLATGDAVLNSTDITVIIVGMAVAFAVSMLAVRFLVEYVRKHDFKPFGYYRIVLGAVLLLYRFVFV